MLKFLVYRSFGLVLALLNKPRIMSREARGGQYRENQYITSLVIVPHRDLAYQFYHWIQKMAAVAEAPSPPLASVAQVLVRDVSSHLTAGVQNLRETPPHILIGTPQALLDVWKKDPESLQLSHLSCVVVDEVDYLIETLPKKDPARSFQKAIIKATRKLQAHPGITRELLDIIYAKRKKMNARRLDESGATQYQRLRGLEEQRGNVSSPQLIMSSATLRSHLIDYLYKESGWLAKDNLLKVKGGTTATKSLLDQDKKILTGDGVSHSVLLVSDTGIENIPGAVPHDADSNNEYNQPIDAETLFASPGSTESTTTETDGLSESEFHSGEQRQADKQTSEYSNTVSPFNPNAFEAIATAFALDVPKIALLVLPSSSPIRRAVYELRDVGVNAHSLDLLVGNKHLLGSETGEDNPTLLVSTLATTRGLDLPELTHVFILGILGGPKVTGQTVDAYLHIAGRVGRFGRGGKVITVVEKDKDMETGPTTGSSKMRRILDTINVTPVQFQHFD